MVERRRYRRYTLDGERSQAWMEEPPYTRMYLVNLSYSGACLESDERFSVGSTHNVRLEPRTLIDESVLVTMFVHWTQQTGDRWRCGGEFLTSSKGWLGSMADEPNSIDP